MKRTESKARCTICIRIGGLYTGINFFIDNFNNPPVIL